MATTKKTEAEKNAATKAAAKTAETKTTAAKAAAKAAEKKTTAAKTTAAKKKTAAKKPAVKKTAPKKTAAKKSEEKVEVFVEFGGVQVAIDEVIKNVKATYGKNAKEIQVYLKPEESKAYFVADGTEGEMNVYFC